MRRLLPIIVLLGCSGSEQTSGRTTPSCKRGVGYGYHSRADMKALSSGVSWWYNWARVPDSGVREHYEELGVEYVPMIWDEAFTAEHAIANIPGSASYLLGFNEPNFGSQANMSASLAADLWPEMEEIADALGLELVSPAVNFCGGNCQDTNPFDYLDDFFSACEGCRVDKVAFHVYTSCEGDGTNHARWLINHIETYKSRFDGPLWLTEFACDNAESLEDQRAFMEDALEYLENEPRIERYAWFAGRADNMDYVNLLGGDGKLTVLGETYVNAAGEACSD